MNTHRSRASFHFASVATQSQILTVKRTDACTWRRFRVHGARCTHLRKRMPYRDPAQKAAWMREYRKRKRGRKTFAPAPLRAASPRVATPEPPPVSPKKIDSSSPQLAPGPTGVAQKRPRNGFKTALQLARTFPFGVLTSQACPYCYDTGSCSPGTRCSYCRSGGR